VKLRTRLKAPWCRAALVPLAALALVTALGSPARAGEPDKPIVTSDDPSAGSNAAAKIMIAQAPLVDLAQAVTTVDPDRAGLGGIQLQVAKHSVQIAWKGDVPDEVAKLVDQARDQGIDVSLRRADYSGAELAKAQDEVVNRVDAYPGLTTVGPLPDGSGLRIGARDPDALTDLTFPVPVTIVKEEPFTSLSRTRDSAPFWAGGVANTTSGSCSTGFAVARYNFFGQETSRGLLTAEHCAPGGGRAFFTGGGTFIGVAGPPSGNFLTPWSDTLYIPTSSAARTWDGGVGVGEFTKAVSGQAFNFPGEFVCTSGARTGVHCANLTYAIFTVAFTNTGPVLGIDLAFDVTGGTAAGAGDSGGPVFTLAPWDPSRRVLAAGMIDNGAFATPCPPGIVTTCFHNVGFVDINYALFAQGVGLLTS
jgi:hypothetical protein